VPGPPKRADARRNYERILAAAEEEIARHGATASLEEIARRAGVGSATLHRHFPTRRALLEAVFHDRVEVLCARARDLGGSPEPGAALAGWLRDVAVFGATTRGLASSMLPGVEAGADSDCGPMLMAAGESLLRPAQQAGVAEPSVSIMDLLTIVNAISLATEQHPRAADEAARLTTIALGGAVRP
jgi:AcrR family transcriptional regulator